MAIETSPLQAPPRGKPEAMAVALAASHKEANEQELAAEEPLAEAVAVVVPAAAVKTSPKKKSTPKKKPPPKKKKLKPELTLSMKSPPMSDAEYANLKALMIQFCRVPLLAEFSRPVTLLHPEVRFNRH